MGSPPRRPPGQAPLATGPRAENVSVRPPHLAAARAPPLAASDSVIVLDDPRSADSARNVSAITAYDSLPARSARMRGCLRQRLMMSSWPRMRPPCVAPISLSVEQVTASTPPAISSRIVGADAKPYGARSTTRPLPSSYSKRQSVVVRDGNQLVDRRRLGEADDLEVRAMHAEDGSGGVGDRVVEVGGPRPVGRPHFPQPGSALLNDVRDAERAADLDELSAGDDHFPAAGNGGQQQKSTRRVVVRQDGSLTAEECSAELREVLVATAARSCAEVEFEIRVAGRDGGGAPPELRDRWGSDRGSCG